MSWNTKKLRTTTAEMDTKTFLGEGQTSHGWFWTLLGRVRQCPAHCSVFTHCKEDSRIYIMCRFDTFYTFWCSTGDLNKEISKWIQCLFWFHFVRAFSFMKTFLTDTDLWVLIACCYKPVNTMAMPKKHHYRQKYNISFLVNWLGNMWTHKILIFM